MFQVKPSDRISARSEFPLLCNDLQLYEAAEIGVDRGEFALQFLERWQGYTLMLIDPYEPYPNMPWNRELDKMTALIRMAPYAEHVRFLPLRSIEATALVLHKKWHLGFVYIDGDHEYNSVRADIAAWWERLDEGGILAGHDFVEGNGVIPAVLEFAEARELTVYHTIEGGTPISFYMHKPVTHKA
jgi:hypothetical protein